MNASGLEICTADKKLAVAPVRLLIPQLCEYSGSIRDEYVINKHYGPNKEEQETATKVYIKKKQTINKPKK